MPVARWHEQIGDATVADGHPRPLGSQRASDRDARRFDAKKPRKGERVAHIPYGEVAAHSCRFRFPRDTGAVRKEVNSRQTNGDFINMDS